MNKTKIYITIDSEEEKQRAIKILNKHGENIWRDITATDTRWYIVGFKCNKTEITLDQLDELLTKEKQK